MSYCGFLTYSGFIVPAATLQKRLGHRYGTFLNKLTITHYPVIGPARKTILYKFVAHNNVNCICLPRTLLRVLVENKILNNIDILFSRHDKIQAQLKIDLFKNQIILVDYLCDNVFTQDRISQGTSTAILNLRAGLGKTYIAGGLIAKLCVRTLYIVTNKFLAKQAYDDLNACTACNIELYDKKNTNLLGRGADVVIIVINSALLRDVNFFNKFAFIILDEVHAYCSEQRREIFRNCSPIMFGMSATTEERNDGSYKIAHMELAFDNIIRAENIAGFTYEDTEFNCSAKIIKYYGAPEYTRNLTHASTGKIFTHYMHNQYISDPVRTSIAIEELINLYDWVGPDASSRHHIYVFAEEIDILRTARDTFITALATRRPDIVQDIHAPELHANLFVGGTVDIENIIKNSRILFTTYGYAGTGISILKMSAILFLTPRKSNMKQILARILRRGSDTVIPRVVIDMVDCKTALAKQYMYRSVAYDFYGFKLSTHIRKN